MKELRVDAPAPSASHEKPAQAVQVQAACAEPMRALAEHAVDVSMFLGLSNFFLGGSHQNILTHTHML